MKEHQTIGYMWVPADEVYTQSGVEDAIMKQYRRGYVAFDTLEEAYLKDPEDPVWEHEIYGEVPLRLIKITYEVMG